MPSESTNRPWLVAVWPGMGQVALSAGYYLMSKLEMYEVGELAVTGVFDVDFAEVKNGLLQKTHRPRSRFFRWRAPEGQRDILVFIGEAQPPAGKYAFCQKVVEFAKQNNVERIFTFAAMATQMHPSHDSRVFAVATDPTTLQELDRPDVTLLEEGHIGGLNGILLVAAADEGLHGICLLGEMPHLFTSVPFPKGSLEVLRVFTDMANIQIDFTELAEQAESMEHTLAEILAKIERTLEAKARGEQPEEEQEEYLSSLYESEEEERLSAEDEQQIERLFDEAARDRSKAYELKRELDRLKVFADYEDRFLDLFKQDNP